VARSHERRIVRKILAIGLAAAALAIPSAAQALTAREPGSFTTFDPCTNEFVRLSGFFNYLSDKHGDRSHTSNVSGFGLTTGNEYRYVFRFVDTTTQGYFEVVRLIGQGQASDESFRDDLGDGIDPTPTCR
jgi:ABC-type transport system substrate-binding protein